MCYYFTHESWVNFVQSQYDKSGGTGFSILQRTIPITTIIDKERNVIEKHYYPFKLDLVTIKIDTHTSEGIVDTQICPRCMKLNCHPSYTDCGSRRDRDEATEKYIAGKRQKQVKAVKDRQADDKHLIKLKSQAKQFFD